MNTHTPRRATREVRRTEAAVDLRLWAGAPLPRAFTLIELLVVIAIAGILAALAVPAIKEFGRSNQQVTATRQMLNDVGRARQLAIANRTTVYMVFLPHNYLLQGGFTALKSLDPTGRLPDLALQQAGGQGRSYALVSLRSIGDQPGQPRPRYLTDWTTLPPGWIIDTNKFSGPALSVNFTNYDGTLMRQVSGFQWTNSLPFPSPAAPPGLFALPYIAFDYSGGLVAARDNGYEVIPLTRGVVDPAIDANGDLIAGAANIVEKPPGNGFEVPNLIVIDGLTGRARLETREVE